MPHAARILNGRAERFAYRIPMSGRICLKRPLAVFAEESPVRTSLRIASRCLVASGKSIFVEFENGGEGLAGQFYAAELTHLLFAFLLLFQ